MRIYIYTHMHEFFNIFLYIFFCSKQDFRLQSYNKEFPYPHIFLSLGLFFFNLLDISLTDFLGKILIFFFFFLPSIHPEFFQVLKYFIPSSHFSESLPKFVNL